MEHPSVAQLLEGGDAVRDHLATCTPCRDLLAVTAPIEGPAPATAPPRVDRRHYVEWTELDAGGMGRAFRAVDGRLGRTVVIKQLQPRPGEPALAAALRARFEREAQLTARLQHPAIVAVYEAGVFDDDDEPFYAMPWVQGRTLTAAIAERPTLAERLHLLPHLAAVAGAVAYAHDQRIVHRDVKPDNVLLGAFGVTVLIDWGLAKRLDEPLATPDPAAPPPSSDDGLTRLGVGTPAYMAPEQARGDAPSTSADVYALGATLYHVLCGAPPFVGGAAARAAVIAGPPRPIDDRVADLPAPLASLVDRAMARNAASRPTAAAFADELTRFGNGELLETHTYSTRELLGRFARRHRAALRVGAVGVVVAALAGVGAVRRIIDERDRTIAATAIAVRARAEAEAREREATRELRRTRGLQARQLAAEPTRRLDALELAVLAASSAPSAALPDEVVDAVYAVVTAGPVAIELAAGPGWERGMTVTPDRDQVAVIGDDHAIRLFSLTDGRLVRELASSQRGALQVRVAPRGDAVVACGLGPVAEVWARDGVRHDLAGDGAVTGCDFLPDGRVVTSSRVFARWDPTTGAQLAADPLASAAVQLAVAADGTSAIGLSDGTIEQWSNAGARRVLGRHASAPIGLAWSGGALVSAAVDGVRVWPGGEVVSTHAVWRFLAAAPDGDALSMARPTSTSAVAEYATELYRLATPPTRALAADGIGHAISASQLAVGTREGRVELWDARAGRIATWGEPTGAAMVAVVYVARPDGAVIVASSRDGRTVLHDARGGEATGRIAAHGSEVLAIVAGGRTPGWLSVAVDGSVRTWDVEGAAPTAFDARGGVLAVARARGADRIALAGLDGAVELRGSMSQRLIVGPSPIVAVALSSDGR